MNTEQTNEISSETLRAMLADEDKASFDEINKELSFWTMRRRFDTSGAAERIYTEHKLKLNILLAKYGLGVDKVRGLF